MLQILRGECGEPGAVYRHGLRRSEAALLTLDDLRDGKIWVERCKHGVSNAYPLHPRSKVLLRGG